ncbi:MAG: DUF4388 domain-containing protein, partial [Kiritimatiellia bacterium]|nr:DUF4388 domain-containing protein [Kiritimatiellia bacterium]
MDQVRMGGQIQAGLLPDLMQLLSNRSEVTGYLELLSDDGAGKIWFRNGQMVDARWGIKSGETAVELMLGIRIGRFRFIEAEYTKEPTIRRETTCIL